MKKIYERIKKSIINIIDFITLVRILRNWQEKYNTYEYPFVIKRAFNLIDKYDLQPGVLSPSFTLPNNQLDLDFIKKFFLEADKRGYDVIKSNVIKREDATTFNLIRKNS